MKRGNVSPPIAGANGRRREDANNQGNNNQNRNNQLGEYLVYSGGNERLARRQQRSGRHRNQLAAEERRRRATEFKKGESKSTYRPKPTNADLIDIMDNETNKERSGPERFRVSAAKVASSQQKQQQLVDEMIKDWHKGGHGYISMKKPDGVFRLIWENWNSLKVFTEKKEGTSRIDRIDATRKRFSADILAGVESQTDWCQVSEDRQFHELFGFGEERKSVAVHNSNEEIKRAQPGGTAMMTFGRFSSYVIRTIRDPTGLGRWCGVLLKNAYKTVRIVIAYRPCISGSVRRRGKSKEGSSVWEQHDRYFRRRGEERDPTVMFDIQLLEQLRVWKAAGEDIILIGDFNQDIYESSFALDLKESDIGMEEQFRKLHEEDAPYSHETGSVPICGVFATAGIDVVSAFNAKHGVGEGDHRLGIYDFCATSLLGLEAPALERPKGRKLQCRLVRTRISYNKGLMKLSNRHRMFKKANVLNELVEGSPEIFQTKFNAWDRELIQLMRSSENDCRKRKTDHISWIPKVGAYKKRIHILRWIQSYKAGNKTNLGNLQRTCSRNELPNPRKISLEEAKTEEEACHKELDEIKKTAPQQRVGHLQDRLDEARKRHDEVAEKEIIQILRREQDRKQDGRIRSAFGKKRAHPASQIAVSYPYGPDPLFSKREEVESCAADHLSKRFSDAHSSPFCSGQLLDDIGHLGAGPAVKEILQGTYVFPEGCDEYAKLLCVEAAKLFAKTAENVIEKFVTRKDFQDWWLTANENIQSSKSGAHFGHYCAAAHNDYLTALHTTKLNLALRTGVPLERWGHGLTVLLEKEFGSVYIDKLRAICLFEADFNWIQKLIFSKRTIQYAHSQNLIPPEQCATSGIDPNQGTMLKQLHNDINRTLHIPAAVVSADLANCYDAVTHAVASIALQAFGAPILAIKLVVTCLQTMFFWLRTAFGIAKNPFHGTVADPFFGLSQGSGWAPPTFQCTSALMINAYKSLGHGVRYISPVSMTVFLLAAILYVDDTDLLMRARSPRTKDEDFFKMIQKAIDDWAKIVMVTGGDLKPKKCHVSVNSYKFVNGKAVLKKVKELPKISFTVPTKSGLRAPIPLIEPTDSRKTLGVMTNTAGKGADHLERMKNQGNEWTDRLRSNRYLKARDGWKSLNTQLKPRLQWGLVILPAEPEKVEEVMDSIYFKSLSCLNVNQNLRKEYRTMPEMYQGLGMAEMNTDRLGKRIYFMRRHWRSKKAMGQMTLQAFETFQMDLGLQGNIFTRDYNRLKGLAESSWFKVTWQLCSHLNASLTINPKYNIPLTREGDTAIMEKFLQLPFNMNQVEILGRCRKFKCVHSMADILRCDGKTVEPDVVNYNEGNSLRTFSHERPRKSDIEFWVAAIKLITSPNLVLDHPLGKFVKQPHRNVGWYASHNGLKLYHKREDEDEYDVYECSEEEQRQRRPAYELITTTDYLPDEHKYASVDVFDEYFVTLHSTAAVPRVLTPNLSFWDVIRSFPNQSLWKYFQCDGDGEWIRRGVMRGTIVLVHDGSYMPKVDPKVCSAAFIIKCTYTNMSATGSIVEKSDSADNYRAEGLGSMMGLLVLRAATARQFRYEDCKGFCDNNGIVKHANAPDDYLVEKQSQSDVISIIKQYLQELPMKVPYEHVYGHLDDVLRWDQLSPIQKLNIRMDKRAKQALLRAIITRKFISDDFPFEEMVLRCGKRKSTKSPAEEINRWQGYQCARALYHKKRIVDSSLFDIIYWEGMNKAMRSFRKMFRTWVTKQVSGCNGCNRHLSKYEPTVENICPACGCDNESTKHVTICPDPGRTEVYNASVESVTTWMGKNDTDPEIELLISRYLKARGTKSFDEVKDEQIPAKYLLLVKYQDLLGWQNFIEGRFTSYLVQLQRDHLKTTNSWRTAETWASQLMKQLLQLTHRLWSHRNVMLHYKKSDGRTITQHEKISKEIQELLKIDRNDLLPADQALLDEDFESLGKASAVNQEYWIASMRAAILAAAHATRLQASPPTPDTANDPPLVDNEGSIRFRRRRKKT